MLDSLPFHQPALHLAGARREPGHPRGLHKVTETL
jgi:hypothetical protein